MLNNRCEALEIGARVCRCPVSCGHCRDPVFVCGPRNLHQSEISQKLFPKPVIRPLRIKGRVLGEQVALSVLKDRAPSYNEPFTIHITKLDGTNATISNQRE